MIKKEYKTSLNVFMALFCLACAIILLCFQLKLIENNGFFILSLFVLVIAYFWGKNIVKQIELNDNFLIVTYIFGNNKIELKDIVSVTEGRKTTMTPPVFIKTINITLKSGKNIYLGINQIPTDIKNALLKYK